MTSGARYNRVFLTGFMGSGKSTVGPILANSVGYDFVDLDALIEAAEGCSISEIFRTRGEAYFRQREQEEILRLSVRPKLIVALGGGTLVVPETSRIIRSSGVLVYLKLSPEQVYQRVRHRGERPLLADVEGGRLSPDELKARIEHLYRQREALYASADITVESDARRVAVTVDRVVRELASLLE
jgi:shikimate kinase